MKTFKDNGEAFDLPLKLYELPRETYFRLADEELRDNKVFFLIILTVHIATA